MQALIKAGASVNKIAGTEWTPYQHAMVCTCKHAFVCVCGVCVSELVMESVSECLCEQDCGK